ncbi:MAG: flagellar FliJ family protein [Acidobacteriota bacterium]
MKQVRAIKNLSTLVAMREREVDHLTADMAAKQVVRQRFVANLERMANLCEGGVAQGHTSPLQALNQGHFKAAILHMADLHRQDLALHDADMAVSQQALQHAAQRREVLGQILSKKQDHLSKEQASREQKGQDDLATQVWLRGRA